MQGEAHLQRFYHERRGGLRFAALPLRPGSVHRVLYPHLASGQLLRQDKENAQLGLHTLLLLDIRVKEPSVEALCRGKKEYEPPRFMSCATCARQMLEVEEARGEKVYGPDSMCVAVARMGQDDEMIRSCTLKEMCNIDMGGPLHSMVLVGETHPLENDMLAMHRATEVDFLPEDMVPSQYLE